MQVFTKIVNQKMEEPISGAESANNFLILRSLNYDGLIDVNVRRAFFATRLEARWGKAFYTQIF